MVKIRINEIVNQLFLCSFNAIIQIKENFLDVHLINSKNWIRNYWFSYFLIFTNISPKILKQIFLLLKYYFANVISRKTYDINALFDINTPFNLLRHTYFFFTTNINKSLPEFYEFSNLLKGINLVKHGTYKFPVHYLNIKINIIFII